MPSLRALLLTTLAVLAIYAQAHAQTPAKMKVFVSVDMEGIAGVATMDQLIPGRFEYERFRGFMTGEALAAIQGAREAGANEFVVADAHGNFQNLLIEQFPPDVRIV